MGLRLGGMPPARGGTDLMVEGLLKRLNPDDYGVHLIVCDCSEAELVDGKKNVLWQHLNYNEPLVQGMRNKFFTRAIDAFVYVSHWQHEKFRYVFQAPVENAYVIKNAIDPIDYEPRKRGEKMRLAYTSAPFRGLDILLDSFELLGRKDAELHVYSSTIIYGGDYDIAHRDKYAQLFERASNMDGVVFHGYATNDEVISGLKETHIYSYPSMFEETSCLAMIEAGAAGCKLVSHNLGALFETGAEYATLVPIRIDRDNIVARYAAALDKAINEYWDFEPMLRRQSDYFNKFYSWDRRTEDWTKLFKELSQ